MKKNSRWLYAALAPAILAGAACTSEMSAQKVRIEVPSIPLIKSGETAEIVLVPFRMDKEVPEFDLNRDLNDYLEDQLKTKFKGRITTKVVTWPAPTGQGKAGDGTADAGFWKKASLGTAGTIVLTGKAAFSQEARKALLSTEKRRFEGPFEPEKKWAERRTYDLKLDLVLLKADTGEILFQSTYQDTINYENMRQPPAFAFHDLLDRIRPRLLRALFGTDKIQDRFLLLK